AHHRRLDAPTAVDPRVVQPTVVAHPVAVDVLVGTRLQPHHFVVPHLQGDVASLRTVRADGGRAVQVPGPRLVQKILRHQRSDRADVDRVVRPDVPLEALFEEGVDDVPVTTLYNREPLVARHFAHEAHASRAHDAAITVIQNISAE